MLKKLLSVLLLSATWVTSANAIVIRENLAGTATSLAGGYWGQSVTTGAGTAWNNLEFNFYAGASPLAWGDLYLLSEEYLGRPDQLAGASTILDIASATANKWIFDAATSISANATYWFYAESQLAGRLTGGTSSGVAGESHYFTRSASSNWEGPFEGTNFTLQGSTVPEPATLALLGLGMAGIGYQRRKRVTA